MSKEKIETVLNFSIHKNLRSFLGLANHFRQFVPMHSSLVKPMQDMIDHSAPKRSAIVWTQASTNSFHDTQMAMSRCPLMYFIDDNILDIRLYTDASDFGIGSVLFQVVDTIWQPIAFISKSLTSTQIRWSTIQKEAYAIFYCCTQLDYLIGDRTFFEHYVYETKSYLNGSKMVHCNARTSFYGGLRTWHVKCLSRRTVTAMS